MSRRPLDGNARDEALDPTRSFIVQAPAGSGKTELLTRRVLALLATVEQPEEVVAITFTRKAAAEMRHRVVAALIRAADPEPAQDPYEAEGLEIARRTLAHDRALGWRLIDDPSRLALRTIDSFAGQLAKRLPVLSSLGSGARTVDDASALYRAAAERFLEHELLSIPGVSRRLDNRLVALRDRCAALLGVRDQWQQYVFEALGDEQLRKVLESMLEALVASRLQSARDLAPPGLGDSLRAVLVSSRDYLRLLDEAGELANGLEARHIDVIALADALESNDGRLPDGAVVALSCWRTLARLLVTTTGTWRKSGDKHAGVPAKGAARKLGVPAADLVAHKASLETVLRSMDAEPALLAALIEIGTLPEPHYRDEEWALIGELGGGLRLLLADLQLVFADRRELDFTEIAQRALQALGDESEPTDLALALDMKLRHLLVDEFQDTSHVQYALFERLVAGWEPDDGRTFFAVGDPMQSIYRFRQGDVGLFLRTIDEGIGPVSLQPLRLSVNFRSVPGVIDWVNRGFSNAFPPVPDRDIGAVTYEPSSAFAQAPDREDGPVTLHLLERGQAPELAMSEAGERVAVLVAEALDSNPDNTVGVLLRARTHAPPVVAALVALGIAYRAVELDRLGDRPVVRDLVALTLALRYPHDRLSWLALLRGPLCGLRLADLHALCETSDKAPLIELIQDAARLDALSDDGRVRLDRFRAEVTPAVHRSARGPLAPWVEAVWLRLGGPVICHDASELDAAERALRRLAELEADDGLWSRELITQAMSKLFAGDSSDAASARVQIMTLHKSKGLEFDTVILPSLAAGGRGDDGRLLDWYETSVDGRRSLLLAPIDAPHTRDEDRSAIGKLLRSFRKRADDVERVRLLYVACTRARQRLHLVATLAKDDAGEWKAPSSNTLLAPLWPILSREVQGGAAESTRVMRSSGGEAALSNEVDSDDAHESVEPVSGRPIDSEGEPFVRVVEVVAPESDESTAVVRPEQPVPPPFERVASDWTLPGFEQFAWRHTPPAKAAIARVEYDWSGSTARDIGTVLHRALQRLAELPAADRHAPDSDGLERLARELRTLGVTEQHLNAATGSVVTGIRNTLDHERGQWLLDPGHEDARCEWALTIPTVEDGRVVSIDRVVVDRTFIDADGTRWIVDYKTGSHEGGRLKEFLQSEVDRYRDQLERYARLLRGIEPSRRIRVGLWFPMVSEWREFSPRPLAEVV